MNDSMRVQITGVSSEVVGRVQDLCRQQERTLCHLMLGDMVIIDQPATIVASEFSYTPNRFDISFELRPTR